MTEKEYIESFGWKPEDLTEEEVKAVHEEFLEVQKGAIILDGVLANKPITPQL